MAKNTYKLLSFDGGINDDSDPRDIADNEFSELQNVAIDEVGKITILGDIKTTHHSITADITATGTGLKAVQTDYDGLADDNAAIGGRTYYITEKAAGITIEDSDGSEAETGLTVTNLNEANMYWVDGALRIYDGDHSNAKTNSVIPTWRGYIPGVLYGSDSHAAHAANKGHIWNSGGSKADKWYTKSAQIKGCFPEVRIIGSKSKPFVGQNLMMGSDNVQYTRATYNDGSVGATDFFAFANEKCSTGTGAGVAPPGVATTRSGMYWGHSLRYYEQGQGSSGGWAPTGTESYQFWCTTVYDGVQESLPQMFTMYPAGPQATAQRTAAGGGISPYEYGPENQTGVGTGVANNAYTHAEAETSLRFGHEDNFNEVGTGMPIIFLPRIKWCDAAYNTATNWTGSGDDAAISGINYNFGAVDGSGNPDASGTGAGSGNPRITGLRVYWASSEDGWSDLWELYEWDFAKGIKAIGSSGGSGSHYNPVDFTSAGGTFASPGSSSAGLQQDYWYQHTHGRASSQTGITFNEPPRYKRYDAMNGHSLTDSITVDSFKASAVSTGRVYIGNVQVDGKVYGDKMLRSSYHSVKGPAFDKFALDAGTLDVATSDGDDIIALLEYSDRILQFKRNSCHIINVSEAKETIEESLKYRGITNPGAACTFDSGIAWVNKNGCYVYDGKQVLNILEQEGAGKISSETWGLFIGDDNYHRIGFNPFKRQLIVLQGTTGDNAYVYDLTTGSWTLSDSMVASGGSKSNFINNPGDGTLLIHDGSGTIDKWADTPTTSTPSIIIATKDIDFGEPSIRKKLYKVYITYKGNGSNIVENYRTNGGSTDYGFEGSGFGNPGSVWTQLELKPDTSAEANNIYSCQLRLTGTAGTDFEINDISFIYRAKAIK